MNEAAARQPEGAGRELSHAAIHRHPRVGHESGASPAPLAIQGPSRGTSGAPRGEEYAGSLSTTTGVCHEASSPPISVQHVETGQVTRADGSGQAGDDNRVAVTGARAASRPAVVLLNHPLFSFFRESRRKFPAPRGVRVMPLQGAAARVWPATREQPRRPTTRPLSQEATRLDPLFEPCPPGRA